MKISNTNPIFVLRSGTLHLRYSKSCTLVAAQTLCNNLCPTQ